MSEKPPPLPCKEHCVLCFTTKELCNIKIPRHECKSLSVLFLSCKQNTTAEGIIHKSWSTSACVLNVFYVRNEEEKQKVKYEITVTVAPVTTTKMDNKNKK